MRLKHEDYTENTNLVIELSEVLVGYTVFTMDSEFSFILSPVSPPPLR